MIWSTNYIYPVYYEKKNSNCIFMCQSTTSGFYCQIIASRYMRRLLEKEFPVNKSRMINRIVCTSVTSVFKSSWRKGHFWSYAGAKTIMKHLFSYQNKKKDKTCWKQKEYAKRNRLNRLTDFEILMPSMGNVKRDVKLTSDVKVAETLTDGDFHLVFDHIYLYSPIPFEARQVRYREMLDFGIR